MKIETVEKIILIIAAGATILSGVIACTQVLNPVKPPQVIVQPCQLSPLN